MNDLLSILSSVTRGLGERLPEGNALRRVAAVHQRLAEPARVAVAGPVSSGKSTLVNGLVAQLVVAVGEGECTKAVTWLRYGEVDDASVELVGGGTRRLAFGPNRSLPTELGVPPDQVERVDVRLYNSALRALTIIDTPGRDSLTDGLSLRTDRLLGVRSDAAVAEADALLYVVTGRPVDDDAALLEEFSRQTEPVAATAANTVLVVSKADRILDRPSGPARLEAIVDEWRDRLGTRVGAVAPVIGLLAQTAGAGVLDEGRAAVLRELARVPREERERWLRSPRRFVADGTVPGDAEARAQLVSEFGTYGLRYAAGLGEHGAAELSRRLAELSGINALRALIATAFGDRAAVLKADAALRALNALTADPAIPAGQAAVVRDALMEHGDRLAAAPEAQRLRELELVRLLASGRLELPDVLQTDVHRLATGATFRQRLGLTAEATAEQGRATAVAWAARWRRFQLDGRRRPEQRRAAHVVSLSLASLARDLGREQAVHGT